MYRLGRIIPLYTRVLKLPKNHRYHVYMKQATLIHINDELNVIIDEKKRREQLLADITYMLTEKINESYYIYTDNRGSFFDPRIKLDSLVWD